MASVKPQKYLEITLFSLIFLKGCVWELLATNEFILMGWNAFYSDIESFDSKFM